MTGLDVDPLPDRPSPAVDADEWTLHHRLFYRLVVGAPGLRTAAIQALYDAVAPVAYEGTTASPTTSRRWRRKLLGDLEAAGMIDAHPTPHGRVWTPSEAVVETEDVPAVQGPPATEGGESSR